jgi:hypothetical protein
VSVPHGICGCLAVGSHVSIKILVLVQINALCRHNYVCMYTLILCLHMYALCICMCTSTRRALYVYKFWRTAVRDMYGEMGR